MQKQNVKTKFIVQIQFCTPVELLKSDKDLLCDFVLKCKSQVEIFSERDDRKTSSEKEERKRRKA